MIAFNTAILAQVIAKALSDAADHPRWINAINRAAAELESNPYIERDTEHGGLLIGSPSGKVYTANGICQCEAYAHGNACWHRAAARLVRRYDEAIAQIAYESTVDRRPVCKGCGEKHDGSNRLCYSCLSRGPKYDVQPPRKSYQEVVAEIDELFA